MSRIRLSVVFLLMLVASGCATMQSQSGRYGGDDLRETVTRFYTHKMNLEFTKAFEYENLSLSPQPDPKHYAQRSSGTGMPIEEFKILDIGEEGSDPAGYTPVKIKLVTPWPTNLNVRMPKGKREVVMDDFWVKKEGKWYHIIRGMSQDW